MLGGAKQMIGLQHSEHGSRASVHRRNGGRVDKRIRLESGRLKRPGGSNPSRSAILDLIKKLFPIHIGVFAFNLLVGFLVFGRSVRGEYGRLDDYTLVVQSVAKNHHFREVFFYSGRVIPAVVGDLLFSPVRSVSDLTYLRIVNVVVLAVTASVLALIVYKLISKDSKNYGLIAGCLIGLTVFVVPASPNAATWAVQSSLHIAMPFALIAGYLIASLDDKNWKRRMPVAFALILLSAFTYQHCVMLAALPVIFGACQSWATKKLFEVKKFLYVFISCGVSLFLNLMFVRFLGSGSEKRSFSQPFAQSLGWFVDTFIPRAINLGVPDTTNNFRSSLVLALLLLVAPILIRRNLFVNSLTCIATCLIAAAVVIPTENWATYRLLFPFQIMLWSSIGFSMFVSFGLGQKQWNVIPVALLSFMLISGLVVSSNRTWENFAVPNSIDWVSVNCVLGKLNPDLPINALVTTDPVDIQSEVISYDEYGVIGSAVDWSLTNMFNLTPFASQRAELDHPVPPIFPKWAAAGQEGTWLSFPQSECVSS